MPLFVIRRGPAEGLLSAKTLKGGDDVIEDSESSESEPESEEEGSRRLLQVFLFLVLMLFLAADFCWRKDEISATGMTKVAASFSTASRSETSGLEGLWLPGTKGEAVTLGGLGDAGTFRAVGDGWGYGWGWLR